MLHNALQLSFCFEFEFGPREVERLEQCCSYQLRSLRFVHQTGCKHLKKTSVQINSVFIHTTIPTPHGPTPRSSFIRNKDNTIGKKRLYIPSPLVPQQGGKESIKTKSGIGKKHKPISKDPPRAWPSKYMRSIAQQN